MKIEISALEARVLGSLIEKELTTPDQYPLSLNSLTLACNQKTSRDPIMELTEAGVVQIIDGLQRKHLVYEKSGFGSRVVKYQQRLCGTDFAELKITPRERGILCVMLLRGPQTLSELRTRTNRLCEFTDLNEVDSVLRQMMQREAGALVARLPRSAGEREVRYVHLLGGAIVAATDAPDDDAVTQVHHAMALPAAAAADSVADRVSRLEAEVAELRAEVERLTNR